MNQAVSASTPAIEFRNVSCRFISPEGKATVALREFSMSVARGEFIAIVGPTGCGKSTTLNLITGLLKPASGEVRVMGRPVDGIDPRIGFVFQADAVFPWRNVIDNVAAGPLFRGRSKDVAYAQAEEWIRKVGLDKFTKHYPHQLSGGMRKRVALAQTFINQPEILLMDEPFSALDMQTRTLMQDELLQLWSANKGSVVFVTHDLEEAIALADRVFVLTARPATLKRVYSIDLPRPRVMSEVRYDARFIEISKDIWHDLREEVQIG
ncbi:MULTISPECIES: ABC transporter ATP-binding protein [Burkholderia]|uniref:Sulfonate/nitrate/taurine transport system ATP-binding protein n=3 Tax=Burkholderia multivorans TaxID=87883 RepID=A0A0H3KB36_BURM1|nr:MULTISPECIES: ABC transporter ATP-binding protein [Burkholderia]ABX13730.1 ABC transporter related [Burkholderia multivorans ATCC 17616]AIO74322.1 ABC transporter family protein [Burkholderia multivorans]AOJ91450.1 mannosyltransferase [Burkholderia multivorans]AOK66159.1 mannosyltransferase [Burkholderia multivorans]AYY60439.1 ABC transporter ATP-binding protein [Burkholderia multivorans]